MSARERDQQGENHEDAICYAHPRDGDRFSGAGATRPVRAATGLSAKRLLQRLPAERVVPHRRVVKFDQLLGNCEGADAWSAPSQHCTGRRQLKFRLAVKSSMRPRIMRGEANSVGPQFMGVLM